MKSFFVRLLIWLAFLSPVLAQTPSCTFKGSFTSATTGAPYANNTANPNCNSFALTWFSTGFTALSVQLEGSNDNVTYTAYTGAATVIAGTVNPSTALSGTIIVQTQSKIAWVRVNVTSKTGTGSISYQVYGYNGVSNAAKNGGGGTVTAVTATDPLVSSGGTTPNISARLTGTTIGGNSLVVEDISPPPANNECATWVTHAGGLYLTTTGAACAISGVLSFNSRTGVVLPLSGDYLASQVTNAVDKTAANTGGAGMTLDMSASTTANAHKVPVVAGATATANGALAYDSTNNNLHAAQNGADAKVATYTATPGNGNCANWSVSGGTIKLGDAGAACGSSSGGGGGVLTYSGPTLSILTGTSFCPVGGGGSCSATETNVDIDSSAAATVSNLYVQLSTALGVGNSVVVTWRDNATSKAVTCTISGASATSCNDTTHSFNVANGDLLDYQMVFTGTIVVTPTITIMSAFGTSGVGVTSVTATGPITSTGGTTPVISATYQGNGAKVQASTGTTTTNDCVKFDANGNTVDAGAACGAGGASVASDVFANLPSCTTSGQTFIPQNSLYTTAFCNGSAWAYMLGGTKVTYPASLSTTALNNFGTFAANTTNGGYLLSGTSSGSGSTYGGVYVTPGGGVPFNLTVAFTCASTIPTYQTAQANCGLWLVNFSTGASKACFVNFQSGGIVKPTVQGTFVNSVGTANSGWFGNGTDVTPPNYMGVYWMRVASTSSLDYCELSADAGQHWSVAQTNAHTNYTTPDSVGAFITSDTAIGGVAMNILSWSVGATAP